MTRSVQGENEWVSVSPMIKARSGIGAAVLSSIIYAVGKLLQFVFQCAVLNAFKKLTSL